MSPHLYMINENAFGSNSDKESPPYRFENFFVSNCNLNSLSQNLFRDWNSLKKLGLGGNPFNCTCEMSWLINNRNIQHFVGSTEPT